MHLIFLRLGSLMRQSFNLTCVMRGGAASISVIPSVSLALHFTMLKFDYVLRDELIAMMIKLQYRALVCTSSSFIETQYDTSRYTSYHGVSLQDF
jgi:hypothetical protein